MNRFYLPALTGALISACPQIASADSYYQVASTAGGNGYYIDVDSESHIKGYVRINMFERKRFGDDLVISMMKTMEFDCDGRRSREIRSVQFGMDGKKIGESVDFHGFSNDVPDDEKLVMEQVRGDHALGEPLEGMVLDFVCGSTQYRERHPFVGSLP
jgi:hypothetical protein